MKSWDIQYTQMLWTVSVTAHEKQVLDWALIGKAGPCEAYAVVYWAPSFLLLFKTGCFWNNYAGMFAISSGHIKTIHPCNQMESIISEWMENSLLFLELSLQYKCGRSACMVGNWCGKFKMSAVISLFLLQLKGLCLFMILVSTEIKMCVDFSFSTIEGTWSKGRHCFLLTLLKKPMG